MEMAFGSLLGPETPLTVLQLMELLGHLALYRLAFLNPVAMFTQK